MSSDSDATMQLDTEALRSRADSADTYCMCCIVDACLVQPQKGVATPSNALGQLNNGDCRPLIRDELGDNYDDCGSGSTNLWALIQWTESDTGWVKRSCCDGRSC